MSSPTPDQFDAFYEAVHKKPPFPWQSRLAKRVCGGDWPRAIALPTAAGKTACIDVAVFALACMTEKGVRQPRRIFFVVDRRIVVDQAWMHAKKLAEVLDRAPDGVLRAAADALRNIAEPGWLDLPAEDRLRVLHKRWAIQDEKDEAKRQKLLRDLTGDERQWFEISPLDVYALRGGMYRESAWARSPLQPTVIASTVDQVGSRLLFRGYGVSPSMMPIHAGLVGNDALILLDEAHCAKPFDQTMQAVEKYRAWGDEKNAAPFKFVSVTATPTEDIMKAEKERQEKRPTEPKLIEADEADDRDETKCVLGRRIKASKPAVLVVAKNAKGKDSSKWGPPLVAELAVQARQLMGQSLGHDADGEPHAVRAVGVIVNRVATARLLAETLRAPVGKTQTADPQPKVILLTGRMRPLDRDRVLADLEPLFSGRGGEVPPTYVVATQCLEVGADLDFHALVTECASLDALRQRFGRLNRTAARPGAKAVIVIRADQTEVGTEDPIYGCSLSNAWKWMHDHADGKTADEAPWIDFGVSSIRAKWEATSAENREAVNAPSPDAPVLFPVHLDCWVQTHPIPTPDPDPALFLHGPKQTGQPDVQVVFRADLGDDPERWAEIVGLCPPSSSEAVAVPIGVFKKWLAGEDMDDDTADVEGGTSAKADDDGADVQPRHALRWRGPEEGEKKTTPVTPNDVTPNDTYVVSCSAPGVERLGDFPPGPVEDYAAEAFQRSRDKALLRLPNLAIPEDADKREETELLDAAVAALADDSRDWVRRAVAHFRRPENLRRRELARHPLGGYVLTGKARLRQFDPTYLDDSEPGESFRGRPVTLEEHSGGVADHAGRFAAGCGLNVELFTQAGLWHDLGKLDPRFQAMLRQSSPRTAVGEALAKSGTWSGTREERDEARAVHGYPEGARHELLSAALVAAKYGTAGADDLLLHLIATHHGSARPFANAVDDPAATDGGWPFAPELFDDKFPSEPYRQDVRSWNAELPERFWRVVRRWGWWGAAYQEAVFRLADHAQSAEEQDREAPATPVASGWVSLPAKAAKREWHALPLTGLDGANPLGFLAALGTLVVCDQLSRAPDRPSWLTGRVTLSWGGRGTPSVPVLHFPAAPGDPAAFTKFLEGQLATAVENHPAAWVVRMLELGLPKDAERDFRHLAHHIRTPRAEDRHRLDWVTALSCESAINADSQLQTVRCDYLLDNIRSVMVRTRASHLRRTLFEPWDYADALNNQSLHWEPSEDRRHAYQWHQPNGDPTRKKGGGMLGANRLALEAWPLFPSFPDGERVRTRGFLGNRAASTFWLWPLWSSCLTTDAVASMLSLPHLQVEPLEPGSLFGYGITSVFRSQRILVGKTPNLTPPISWPEAASARVVK